MSMFVMESSFASRLLGWETHGFITMEDLDVPSIMKEATGRWLRPNEIHAMLSNHAYFNINVKPVNLPKGGTIVFFDRKKLRNFRKDGHKWKKKKDGKTVKEAHEHLKVGTEEKIHVYYAHGEDNSSFVRRCYWLLDKAVEHIVLVHYRETQELQGSPVTPVNSDFSSDLSDPSRLMLEGSDLQTNQVYSSGLKECIEAGGNINVTNYEMRLHEINTLEWDELLASNESNEARSAKENMPYNQQYKQNAAYNLESNGGTLPTSQFQADMLASGYVDPLAGIVSSAISPQDDMLSPLLRGQLDMKNDNGNYDLGAAGAGDSSYETVKSGLQTQDSFGKWMSDIIVDSPGSVDDPYNESSVATSHGSFTSPAAANQEGSVSKQIFCITDMSPAWASSTEKTKVLVVGFFHREYQHLAKSNMFCVCGDLCVPAETIQVGVFRCMVSPHTPGLVNFYLSIDRCTAISQVVTFEFRSPVLTKLDVGEDHSQLELFRIQTRLAHLLFSTSKSLDILSSKASKNALDEAKKFALKYSNIADSWAYFTKLIENGQLSVEQAKDTLFELAMKSRLKEWLLERIVDGSRISERDTQGQGVLHLCAILGYTWAVYPISFSGLSLDFRDKFGWTALHWAAYYGREKMVAALLSAGAKANLVTDPTSENPGGCTAADIASRQGFEGLAVFLSEKALIQQFEDMKIAGNAGGSLETPSYDTVNSSNITEEDIYLKDTLTAYRTAADAAARIQSAFRERSFKQKTKDVEFANPETEARYITAAMKIQHAYRNYETHKKLAAAARIQYRFRTWKLRREFLKMRQQAIRIQAVFRGFQVRRQYRKICWSVGVLEKAVLRWRRRRKGFRGLQVEIHEPVNDQRRESDTEEDFYRASRKQAEVRVEKAVVRVQAMFRSRQAQQEYRRMKLAQMQAEYEFEESANPGCHLRGMQSTEP